MGVRRGGRNTAIPESGYALLVIMFLLDLLVVSLSAITQATLTEARREKEAEMIWRGQQYARGVRMYYSKMRRFPTSLDDLTQPKTGIRFMRKAYKDPMNEVDGSWRLIYVGPNGQLIGSLNQYTIDSSGYGTVSSPSSSASFSAGSSPFGQGPVGPANSMSTSLSGSNQLGGSGQTTSLTSAGNANGVAGNSSTNGADQGQLNGGYMDSSNTFGGNIIGVGSKVNKSSFLVYQRAKNYRLFEFVWDPSKGAVTVGNASAGIGTPVQGLNGITPVGTNNTSDFPIAPGSNPTQNPVQDPLRNQNPPQN
jgi:hypothetical protein